MYFFHSFLYICSKISNIFLMSISEIGALIVQRRNILSLNQEDLAEMAGISTKTIYLMEQGKGNVSLKTLGKILDIVGLDILIRIKSMEE